MTSASEPGNSGSGTSSGGLKVKTMELRRSSSSPQVAIGLVVHRESKLFSEADIRGFRNRYNYYNYL